MNDLGRASAYLALFSEIAIILLVTTLLGVSPATGSTSASERFPSLRLTGMLVGFGLGGVGVYRLIVRFLARLDKAD